MMVDGDQRNSRGARHTRHTADIDATVLQVGFEAQSKIVIADFPDHSYRRTEPGSRHRLICTFSAGEGLKSGAGNRLTGAGNTGSYCHKVEVNAADNNDGFHCLLRDRKLEL